MFHVSFDYYHLDQTRTQPGSEHYLCYQAQAQVRAGIWRKACLRPGFELATFQALVRRARGTSSVYWMRLLQDDAQCKQSLANTRREIGRRLILS
jgi:hypothetical protein